MVKMSTFGFLLALLCAGRTLAQEAQVNFEVTEELGNSFIGSVSTSQYLTSRYDDTVIEQFEYELTAGFSQDASLYQLDASSGDLRTSPAGIDREAHCAGAVDCYLHINVAIFQQRTFLQVNHHRKSIFSHVFWSCLR